MYPEAYKIDFSPELRRVLKSCQELGEGLKVSAVESHGAAASHSAGSGVVEL